MKKIFKTCFLSLLFLCLALALFACDKTKKPNKPGANKPAVIINAPDALVFYKGLQDKEEFALEKFARAIDTELGKEIEITKEHIENYDDIDLDVIDIYDVRYAIKKNGKKFDHVTKLSVKDGSQFNALPTLEQLKEKSKTQPIKIKLWHANGDTISSLISFYAKGEFVDSSGKIDQNTKKLAEAFEDTSELVSFTNYMASLGVKVEVEITKNGKNYEELLKNASTATGGGQLPDIIQGYPDHVYGYNSGRFIENLVPYIYSKNWGYGYSNGEIIDEKGYNDFYTPYRLEQTISNNIGDTLSIPFQKSTEVLVYNKDLLAKAGVTTKMLETWEGIMEASKKVLAVKNEYIDSLDITADEKKKAKEEFVPFTYDSGNAFITLLKQYGGKYTSRQIDENGKAKGVANFLKDQATVDMLQQVGTWAREGLLSNSKKWAIDYSTDKFKNYTVAMIISSSAGVRYNLPFTNDGKFLFDVDVAPVPYVDSYNRNYMQQGPGLSIVERAGSTPEQKLVSWLFLKHLTSVKVQSHLSRVTGYSPVRESVSDQSYYQSFLANSDKSMSAVGKDEAQKVLIAKSLKKVTENTKHMVYDLPFTGSSECRATGKQIFDRIILLPKEKSIAQEIAQALTDAENSLASVIK